MIKKSSSLKDKKATKSPTKAKDNKKAVIDFVTRAEEGKPYFGIQITKKFSTGGAIENHNDQVKRKYGGGKL